MLQVQELGGQEQVSEEYEVFFLRLTCGSGEMSLPEYKQTLEIEHVPVGSIVEGTEMSICSDVVFVEKVDDTPVNGSSDLLFFGAPDVS